LYPIVATIKDFIGRAGHYFWGHACREAAQVVYALVKFGFSI